MNWIKGRRRSRDDDGYVLVFLSLMLVVMMVFAAFTVDIGYFYSRANRVQRAADSAALAGVVFMPSNFSAATTRAREVAKLNGYEHGVGGVTVDVQRVTGAPRQLKVVINDPHVKTFFGRVVRDEISLTRASVGEYVGSIPLGSPTNALGTGALSDADYVPDSAAVTQNFWLAASGYCTAKEDGDRFLSRFNGNKTAPNNYTCSSTTLNTEYNAGGYEYVVDVPCTRTDPSVPCDPTIAFPGSVSIQMYNPWFDVAAQDLDIAVHPNKPLYPDRRTIAANPSNAAEQTRLENTAVTTYVEIGRPTADPQVWIWEAAQTFGTCKTPGTATAFTAPDCTGGQVGGGGWVDIRTGINTAGRWKVRVRTADNTVDPYGYGTNQFSLRAMVNGAFASCDSRTAPTTCPGVSGDSSMSVFANSAGSTAEFFLARLAPATEFQGKQVRVRLWDTGEGMQSLQLVDPNGIAVNLDQVILGNPNFTGCTGSENILITPGSTTLDVSGSSPYGGSFGCGVSTSARYSQSKYNDRMIEVTITLPTTYTGGSGDGWWKIRYAAASGPVADRTTWEVKLVGDPVHLRRD